MRYCCCVFAQAAAGGDVSVVGQSDDCDESEMVDDEVEVRAVALFQFILQCTHFSRVPPFPQKGSSYPVILTLLKY